MDRTVQGILADVRKDVEAFRGAMPELPPEQKARQRRRSNIFTGLQFIMLGVALPLGFYIFKLMMFFGSVSQTERVVAFSLSGLCIVLGVIAILRSGKD